jgi:hypothetical protein
LGVVVKCRLEKILNFAGLVTGCEIAKYAPPTKAKNRFNGWYLYCSECQRIMTFAQQKEYSFLSPIKQRIRDSSAEATESKEGFREFTFFCKSLCVKHFNATKKSQSVDWLKFIWQRGLEPLATMLQMPDFLYFPTVEQLTV